MRLLKFNEQKSEDNEYIHIDETDWEQVIKECLTPLTDLGFEMTIESEGREIAISLELDVEISPTFNSLSDLKDSLNALREVNTYTIAKGLLEVSQHLDQLGLEWSLDNAFDLTDVSFKLELPFTTKFLNRIDGLNYIYVNRDFISLIPWVCITSYYVADEKTVDIDFSFVRNGSKSPLIKVEPDQYLETYHKIVQILRQTFQGYLEIEEIPLEEDNLEYGYFNLYFHPTVGTFYE